VRPARRLTAAAYLVQLAYIPWLMVMFALGYAVYAMFDVEPGLGVDLFDQGFLGRLVNLLYFALLALPSWVGAALATRSRKEGGGRAASIAMWQNLAVGAALMILSLFGSV
jgi:hypothetical protein